MNKFYPLEHNEFLRLNALLTDGELRVCLYLMSIDPFCDRNLEIETAVIAEQLGLNRRTIQKALNKLDELEIIDWKVTKQKISGKWRLPSVCVAPQDRQANVDSQKPEKMANVDSSDERRIADDECRIAKANVGSPQTNVDSPTQPETVDITDSQKPSYSKINKTNKIRSENEDFLEKDHEIKTKDDQKAEVKDQDDQNKVTDQETQDIDRELKNFIIENIQRTKKTKLNNPDSYVKKCLEKDGDHWRSLYQESKKPTSKPRDIITENIYLLESSLSGAIRNRDYDYAIAKLEGLTDMQEQIFSRHPDWRELLCA